MLVFQDLKKNSQLTIVTDRSQGGSSIQDGIIELMVNNTFIKNTSNCLTLDTDHMFFLQRCIAVCYMMTHLGLMKHLMRLALTTRVFEFAANTGLLLVLSPKRQSYIEN